MNSIHEILEYGPIVASDEELDILVTWNAAYYNLWVGNGGGQYECTDCYCTEEQAETTDIHVITNAAERYLDRVRSEGEED